MFLFKSSSRLLVNEVLVMNEAQPATATLPVAPLSLYRETLVT